ncbi:MAG: permease [Chloroflexota bacterium]
MDQVLHAITTGAGLFWKALWALAIGYAFSSLIQVFVSRSEVAKHLGKSGLREIGLGMVLGPISSSCSFAALSAARALFGKGAALIPVLAFLFASTNLSFEVGVLTWVFLGWQFMLALYLGAFVLVAAMTVIVRLTCPSSLVEQARKRAQEAGQENGMEGMSGDPSEGLPDAWQDRLRDREAWVRTGRTFIMEWQMVWKDLLIGFLVAGFIAVLVPDQFFQALFPQNLSPWLLVPIHALLGPVLALLTFIGSMGNGPLAAILWQNGVLFAGIVAFLYSDFIVVPSMRINARYYGWAYTAYLAAIFSVCSVVAGIVMHVLFWMLGLIPEAQQGRVQELATFAIDYTFWLNLLAIGISVALVWLGKSGAGEHQEQMHAAHH